MASDRPEVRPWVTLHNFDELEHHTEDILQRLNKIPNCVLLFHIDSFRLLREIGVNVSLELKDAIVRSEPTLSLPTGSAYDDVANSRSKQSIQGRMKGLFRRTS